MAAGKSEGKGIGTPEDETIGHQEGMAVGNDTEGVDIDVDMDTAVDASRAKAKVMSGVS